MLKEEAPEIKSNSPLQDFDENDDVNVEEEDIEDEEI